MVDQGASAKSLASDSSRRAVLRRAGGGAALAALVASGLGGRVLAQQGTPEADGGQEGGYVAIRLRTVKADRSADELTELVRAEFVPLVREVPGFVSYWVVWNEETREWAAVGVFADREGAEESNRRAAEWGGQSRANDFVEGDPIAIQGEIVVAAGAATPEPATVAPAGVRSTPIAVSSTVDADGLLRGDAAAEQQAVADLRAAFAPLAAAGCRIGFVITEGSAPDIGTGNRIADAVNELVRREFPDLVEPAGTGFYSFANVRGETGPVTLLVFPSVGCEVGSS